MMRLFDFVSLYIIGWMWVLLALPRRASNQILKILFRL